MSNKYGLISILFFLLYFLLGVFIYEDYGMSWDESMQRQKGQISTNYIHYKVSAVFSTPEEKKDFNSFFNSEEFTQITSRDKDFGVFYEVILVGIERAFSIEDPRSIYLMRHFMTFLAFFIGSIFFYKILMRRFSNWKFALLGVLFLILTPRIFAQSFYNSKDPVLLAFFIIATYTLIRFLEKKSYKNAIIHALACAAVLNIRIVGIIVPAVTFLFIFFELLKFDRLKITFKKYLLVNSTYVVLLMVSTIVFWPYLWETPIANFANAFLNMSQIDASGIILFYGKYIETTDIPWYYISSFLFITTPEFYIILFIAAIFFFLYGFFDIPKGLNRNNKLDLLFALLLILPILAVIMFKSVVYDGWRHMYFIYPAFLLIALTGLQYSFQVIKLVWEEANANLAMIILVTFISISVLFTGCNMLMNHPYQNVYFNVFAGSNTANRFELDYWGLAYREGLEFILENDNRTSINIHIPYGRLAIDSMIIRTDDRHRLRASEMESADYVLYNFRVLTPGDFEILQNWNAYMGNREIYSVVANRNKIMGVYRMN